MLDEAAAYIKANPSKRELLEQMIEAADKERRSSTRAKGWRYTVNAPCRNIPGHVVVTCTKSMDYHTVGGSYIVKEGTL